MLPTTFDKRKASPVDSDFIDVKIARARFEANDGASVACRARTGSAVDRS
jgi:hypothetical protein